MEKLELEQLAPYLPYGLKGVVTSPINKSIDYLESISLFPDSVITLQNNGDWYFDCEQNEFDFEPILRPLSDYKDINSDAMNDLGFDLSDQIEIQELATQQKSLASMSYSAYQIMCEKHIDFNRLIEKGLAIDINTIK